MEILSFWKSNSVFKKKKKRLFKIRFLVVYSLSHVWLFCDPMNYSSPGSSVHGICQAGILEWVAASFSQGPSWPRDGTWVFCTAGGFFTSEPSGKPNNVYYMSLTPNLCIQLVGTFITKSISPVSIITVSWSLSVGRKKRSDTWSSCS